MRFEAFSNRGLDYAVTLANTAIDQDVDIYQVAVQLLQDPSRPKHRSPTEVTDDDVDRLRRVATHIRKVFEAESQDEAMVTLNLLLQECGAQPVAARHDDEGWHMHFARNDASASDLIGATASVSLAIAICDYGMSRIGICEADRCYYAYADNSRNNRKRYCSVRCATRASVAAHRQRVRESA